MYAIKDYLFFPRKKLLMFLLSFKSQFPVTAHDNFRYIMNASFKTSVLS